MSMPGNQTYSVELKARQMEFLEEMVKVYDLPDTSKALRCLINYAVEKADRRDEIFSEIRCLDC